MKPVQPVLGRALVALTLLTAGGTRVQSDKELLIKAAKSGRIRLSPSPATRNPGRGPELDGWGSLPEWLVP